MQIDHKLRSEVQRSIEAGFSDDVIATLTKQLDAATAMLTEDLTEHLKHDVASTLSYWVALMAQKSVEAILHGDESELRRFLSCERRGEDGKYVSYTGRSDGPWPDRNVKDQHPVIDGKLFEQGALKLRKQIVETHAEVLKDERMRDLEDQVRSLAEQVRVAERKASDAHQRLIEGLGP